MAKTISNLRTQTRTYLDEASQSDWLDTEVDQAINDGYHEIITAIIEAFEEYYIITSLLNTVADQQEYATTDSLPSDIFKIRRVEINFDVSNANSVARRAIPVSMDSVITDLGNQQIGATSETYPNYYFFGLGTGSSGVKLGFLPVPTRSGTNAIKIWYVPSQSDLTDSNTNVNIPYADRYYKLISLYAASTLLRKGQQEEIVAAKYMAEFNSGLTKMKQQLKSRIADASPGIVESGG